MGKDLFVSPVSCLTLVPQEGCGPPELALTREKQAMLMKPV